MAKETCAVKEQTFSDLAKKIASIVGFNFTIVPTKSHGSMKNGQWNGMIKELLEEVNIKK